MRNPTDYTNHIKEAYPYWSYDHLIRCNRYLKIYLPNSGQTINQCIELYKNSNVQNKVITAQGIAKLSAGKSYLIA